MATINDAYIQIDENIGFAPATPVTSASIQVDENIGFLLAAQKDAFIQVDENVQIALPAAGAAAFLRLIRKL